MKISRTILRWMARQIEKQMYLFGEEEVVFCFEDVLKMLEKEELNQLSHYFINILLELGINNRECRQMIYSRLINKLEIR